MLYMQRPTCVYVCIRRTIGCCVWYAQVHGQSYPLVDRHLAALVHLHASAVRLLNELVCLLHAGRRLLCTCVVNR